jgi:hypothetical protein
MCKLATEKSQVDSTSMLGCILKITKLHQHASLFFHFLIHILA